MANRVKWTPKKKEAFLNHLRVSANITFAARSVGISKSYVYELKTKDEKFAKEWEDAIDEGVDLMERELSRRAFEGYDKPIFHKGVECGVVREYSDLLGIFLLKAHRPERFRERYDIKSDNKHTYKKVDEMTDDELDEIIERSAGK